MRELLNLTKISLINGFNLHGLNIKNLKIKKDTWKPILFVIFIIAMIPTYNLYIKIVDKLDIAFILINQETYFVSIAYNVLFLITFLFGLMYIMSYFYFSKETEMLMPLPISQKSIIISKFIVLLFYEYILTFLFLIPIFIVNGINTEASIFYYILSIITLLVTPVAPLALSGIVIMIIMKFTNIKGKKDLFRIISMFLVLFIVLGAQLFIQRSVSNIPQGQEQDYINTLLSNNKELLNNLGYTNPLSKWLGISLMLESINSILYYLLFIFSNIIVFMLFIYIGEHIYLAGIIGGQEVSSNKKKLTKLEFDKEISKTNPAYMAIFKTDLTLLIKTPIYLLNCVSIVILVPFILILMPILGGSVKEIDMLKQYYLPYIDYINFGLAGLFMLYGVLNPTASTTFSREGKYFWLSRILPAKPRDQIIGRALSPFILQIFLVIVMLVGMVFIVPLQLSTIILSTILGLTGSIPLILMGMLIDIERPLLTWTNPQRAVKQNLNVVMSMGIGLGITAALGGLTYLMFIAKFSIILITIIDLLLIIILSIILYKLLLKRIEKRFLEIED